MLEVAMRTTVKTLYEKGHNKTQIAKMLGIDRKTVRKILSDRGAPDDDREGKSGWPSRLDKHREFIQIQMAKGMSIVRIHEDLKRDYGVGCGYTTLRDYIAKIRKTSPHAYMILDSLPGEESQVDFGYIGTLKVKGVPKKAWVFAMSLSYSRYMYAQITLDQSVPTFIHCHINAFRYFGGVPETVKIDNLKAAIAEADFYEPTVQRSYAAFADHYGFLPDPCRVRTPTDKGKIEANIKYIKENCFRGREFASLEEAQSFLEEWLGKTANRRTHGTTRKVPAEVFGTIEKEHLKPLPAEEFTISRSAPLNVRTDCHVVYEGNRYSVPYAYIGLNVKGIEINHMLRIYYEGKEIALHPLIEGRKGGHSTDKNHYPTNKTITHEELLSRYQDEMGKIGPGALAFLERFKETDMFRCHHYRSLSGILALRKRYGEEAVDRSCRRAVRFGSISYQAVKKICSKGLYLLPLEEDTAAAATVGGKIRSLSEYRAMSQLGVIGHE